jgi:hypothetical protein
MSIIKKYIRYRKQSFLYLIFQFVSHIICNAPFNVQSQRSMFIGAELGTMYFKRTVKNNDAKATAIFKDGRVYNMQIGCVAKKHSFFAGFNASYYNKYYYFTAPLAFANSPSGSIVYTSNDTFLSNKSFSYYFGYSREILNYRKIMVQGQAAIALDYDLSDYYYAGVQVQKLDNGQLVPILFINKSRGFGNTPTIQSKLLNFGPKYRIGFLASYPVNQALQITSNLSYEVVPILDEHGGLIYTFLDGQDRTLDLGDDYRRFNLWVGVRYKFWNKTK